MTPDLALSRDTGRRLGTGPTATDIGILLLRLFFGSLLFMHGTQKLCGWFGGDGPVKTAALFDKMGYHPGKFFGTLASLCEVSSSVLIILGLLMPLASAIALGTMINAVHQMWHSGLFGKGHGSYEVPLQFALVAVILAFTGAGRLGLDHGRPWQRHGIGWGMAAVALGCVTGALVLLVHPLL